jgi:peptide-methionine (S)-S-oxide reductase
MKMFFGSLFSNGKSLDAIKSKNIAYKTLDHPGPELASFAGKGLAPEASLRDPNLKLATFAGGCFWGLELAYQRVPGVMYTAVGYTQGFDESPTYDRVCSGSTGHTEAVVVYYNPDECSYNQLLDVLFDRIDPTQVNRQGNDRGTQYRTGVYFHSPEQEQLAKAKFEEVTKKYPQSIATELKAAKPFWPAERYHQQYLEKGGQSADKGSSDRIRCYG